MNPAKTNSKRAAVRAWLTLPPMVTRERAVKVGGFRMESYRPWTRPPVRDSRFPRRSGRSRGWE